MNMFGLDHFDNPCLLSHFGCISETTLLQKLARNVTVESPLCVLHSVFTAAVSVRTVSQVE